MRIHPTVFLICLLLLLPLFGAQGQSRSETLQSVLDQLVAQDSFSGVVLLAERGEVLACSASGSPDRTLGKPMRLQTKFRIASVTKSFTALLIMQLYEAGRLQLDQPVADLLPGLGLEVFPRLTVHHLLNHTSGLPNEPDAIYAEKLSPEAIVRRLISGQQGKAKVGKSFNYNNVDYLLLGLIVEKHYEASWAQVVRERILEPLAMDQTGFLERDRLPGDLAKGYLCRSSDCREEPEYFIENFHAAGAMYSTAEDLLKWDQALYGERLLSEKTRALMYRSDPDLGYVAYGSWTFRHPFAAGNPFTVERRGGILGFHSVIMRFPEAEKTLIILSNTDRFNPDTFGNEQNIKERLVQALFAE